MELSVSGPVVEGTFPTPSPGWITPVTFVLSVWAASLVMACCSGAACYKAWFMPRQSHIVVRESGNPIRTRRDSSRSTMTADRTRNTMTAEERGSSLGSMETPSSTPGVESAPEESRTVSPARKPRRRSLSSSRPRLLGNAKPRRNKGKTHRREAKLQGGNHETNGAGGESRGAGRKALETAIDKARSGWWRRRAKEKFTQKFFTESTWASKSSKRRKIEMVAQQCGYPLAPVTTNTIVEIAAVLDEARLKAADQYLAEAKWAHIEGGHVWSDLLERKFTMCKRALKRDNGPEKRAQEVKLEEIPANTWGTVSDVKCEPRRIAWVFAWAVIWMLRSIEVVNVKVGHVNVDWKKKTLRLKVPKSKMDQVARGESRTLGCCGKCPCTRHCAWSIGVGLLSEAPGDPEESLFPRNAGKTLSRIQLVLLWQKHLDTRATGHSARRSGAMMYARQGLPLFDIAFLGRWKSSAVMRYMNEALEQLPMNVRDKGSQQEADVATGLSSKEDRKEEEIKIVKVIQKETEKKTSPATEMIKKPERTDQKLWAISRNSRGRVRHLVACASWGIPLENWSTTCGWHFARHNVKVELTKFKVNGPRECLKCKTIEKERDKVKGGWELAQTVGV